MARMQSGPRGRIGTLLLAFVALASACDQATPSTPAGSASASSAASDAPATGRIPVLIDTDLAGDDILAVMALLREPTVEVLAIAVDGNGEVHCPQGLRNLRLLLAEFEASHIPIGCGRTLAGEHGRLFPDEWRVGADDFYGVRLPSVPGTKLGEDAAELIEATVAASPQPVTIVALGPWTNLADAFAAWPDLATRVAGIHAMAGAIDVPGNMAIDDRTPADGVEWNVGVDPGAVEAVLATDVPVTLVPLDATNDVPVPADFASILEEDHAAAGADIAFEMFVRAPALTVDTSFWDTLAVLALVQPALVEWEELTIGIVPDGRSAGRLHRVADGRPIRAAMSADAEGFMTALLEALRRGAPRSEPFTIAGELDARWDDTGCHIADGAIAAGTARVTLTNDSATAVLVFLAGVRAPHTWADAVAFIRSADLSDPAFQVPEWLTPIGGGMSAEPGGQVASVVMVPAGTVGLVCATGDWPTLEFIDGGSFVAGG